MRASQKATFSTFLTLSKDANGDGILSWDDFLLLAEKFTKLQRKGKVEPEVLARWTSIFDKWWSALSTAADYNKVRRSYVMVRVRAIGVLIEFCDLFFGGAMLSKATRPFPLTCRKAGQKSHSLSTIDIFSFFAPISPRIPSSYRFRTRSSSSTNGCSSSRSCVRRPSLTRSCPTF